MKIAKTLRKLEKYQQRLEDGRADQIKPKHVQLMIEKLTTKETELVVEVGEATKPGKRERLNAKLATIRERIEEAQWLLAQF